MITVQVLINGEVIYARTAVNIGKVKDDWVRGQSTTICKYKNDDGSFIEHDRKHGAVKLAKKMLDTIKED